MFEPNYIFTNFRVIGFDNEVFKYIVFEKASKIAEYSAFYDEQIEYVVFRGKKYYFYDRRSKSAIQFVDDNGNVFYETEREINKEV